MKDHEMLIFDCDGTLVDSEYLNNLATLELLKEEGLIQFDMDYAFQHFVGLRLKFILAEISKQTGHTFPNNMSERYVERVETLAPQYMKIIPGAEELVSAAKNKMKICVASNGQRDNVISSLERAGLKKYFPDEHIFTGVMVARPKPAPDLFLMAADKMGATPQNCIVIEDSVAGVTGAVAAKMYTLGFVGTHTNQDTYSHRLKQAGAAEIFASLIHIREQLFK